MPRKFLLPLLAIALACTAVSARAAAPVGAAQRSAGKKAAPDRRGQIIDELRADYGDVVDQLARKNTDASMRAKQQRIIDNLKRLLDEEDPPPDANAPSAPDSASPPDQPPAPQTRKAPIEPKKPLPGNVSPRESPAKIIDEPPSKKTQGNAWPSLPPRQREALDAHAQDRYPPRYEELLRAYYRNLAQGDGPRE